MVIQKNTEKIYIVHDSTFRLLDTQKIVNV